jgi:uncharacterized protein HemX
MTDDNPHGEHPHVAVEATDPVPNFSIGTWLALGSVLFSLGGSWASFQVTKYQVDELKHGLEVQVADAKEAREKFELQLRELAVESRDKSTALDTRTTRLEERFAAIDKKLDTVISKIDDISNRGHR